MKLQKILLVVENKKLIGVLTDGDIRRWILKNGNLNDSVDKIMIKSPKFIYEEDRNNAKKILKEKSIEAIPVLNYKDEIIDIVFGMISLIKRLNWLKSIILWL